MFGAVASRVWPASPLSPPRSRLRVPRSLQDTRCRRAIRATAPTSRRLFAGRPRPVGRARSCCASSTSTRIHDSCTGPSPVSRPVSAGSRLVPESAASTATTSGTSVTAARVRRRDILTTTSSSASRRWHDEVRRNRDNRRGCCGGGVAHRFLDRGDSRATSCTGGDGGALSEVFRACTRRGKGDMPSRRPGVSSAAWAAVPAIWLPLPGRSPDRDLAAAQTPPAHSPPHFRRAVPNYN